METALERIERLSAEKTALELRLGEALAALKAMTDHYVRLASSGDCGFWNADAEPIVISARAVIAKAEAKPTPAIIPPVFDAEDRTSEVA